MSTIRINEHQYGKAENRVVRIHRKIDEHTIMDVNVSTCLRGDFDQAYITGDQSTVLPTDTQKQTVFVFAKTQGITSIEEYGQALAEHFVTTIDPVTIARIELEQYNWERVKINGKGHAHTWIRSGQEIRTANITYSQDGTHIVGGLKDLIILKSTGSQFHGFLKDKFTILEPTVDRIMATSLLAQWRFASGNYDWNALYSDIKDHIVAVYAELESLALQQTLYKIAEDIIAHFPIVEVRLSAPNKHHFNYDIERFGFENYNEVYIAADRPYGLIQVSVIKDGEPEVPVAWECYQNWAK